MSSNTVSHLMGSRPTPADTRLAEPKGSPIGRKLRKKLEEKTGKLAQGTLKNNQSPASPRRDSKPVKSIAKGSQSKKIQMVMDRRFGGSTKPDRFIPKLNPHALPLPLPKEEPKKGMISDQEAQRRKNENYTRTLARQLDLGGNILQYTDQPPSKV